MDVRAIFADGMAPFLRNGKCRRLSSHGLDCVCILLSCIISHWERVSIAWEGGCGVDILGQTVIALQ